MNDKTSKGERYFLSRLWQGRLLLPAAISIATRIFNHGGSKMKNYLKPLYHHRNNAINKTKKRKKRALSPASMSKRKIWTVRLLTLFFLFILPVLTLLISEDIIRQITLMPVTEWTSEYTGRFLLNAGLMLALFNILYVLPRKSYMLASLFLSGLLIVFAVANKMKMELIHSPVAPNDFALLGELTGLNRPVNLNTQLIIGIGAAAIVIILVILLAVPRVRENWKIKIGTFLLSSAFLIMLWTDYPVSLMQKVNFETTRWQLEVGMFRNGLFGNFVLLAKKNQIEPPDGYSKDTIESIASDYEPSSDKANEKPNIIFLMSESFVDPYHFGKEHFSKDPIPNFRQLYENSMHGTMLTAEFGGGTANVEFEALTGFSKQFLPGSSIAYQMYIKEPLPSVAYAFRDAGYETTAIHAFYGWYYQRQSVYRLLGFNQFIPGEFMNLDYENGTGHGFPTDKHMTNSILDTIDYSKERDFIHAVSTEAHMPYPQIPDSEFLKTDTLPETARQHLNRYTEKIHNVDEELGRLVEELKKRNEPSILVFFGDHYPSFADNDAVYGEAGTNIATDMSGDYEDFIATHGIPYFIWNSESDNQEELDLSPNQFGSIVLEQAGVKGNTVTAILSEMRENNEAIIPYNQWQEEMGSRTERMKDIYMLQYDLLHGERYAENIIPDLIAESSEDYHLGLLPEIEILKVTENSDQYKILARGAPKFSKVMTENGEEITTEWQLADNGMSYFTVSKKNIEAGRSVFLAVYNSRESLLRKSVAFTLEGTE